MRAAIELTVFIGLLALNKKDVLQLWRQHLFNLADALIPAGRDVLPLHQFVMYLLDYFFLRIY